MTVAETWSWVVSASGYIGLLIVVTAQWWVPALKSFASKWLDNRFAQKLQEANQAFQRQLRETEQKHDVLVRHLQSSIDREFDRATRLHTEEFKALSRGWNVVHEAYWRTRQATARGYSVHDFSQMEPGQADPFIRNHAELENRQKDTLLAIERPQDRNEQYRRWWWWIQYQNCEKARMKLVMFIDRNAIFMRPEIREVFDRLQRLISDALIELQMRIQGTRGEGTFDRSAALVAAEGPIYKDLEAKIHQRLWSSTLNPARPQQA